MLQIITFILGRAINILPNFIARRLWSPNKVSTHVHIELDQVAPSLNGTVPYLALYFKITNLTPYNLVLDRLLLEIWFGQPTLYGSLMKRISIPSREIVNKISYKSSLTSVQKQQIEAFVDNSTGRGEFAIYLTAYFESKIGVIEIVSQINRNKI